MLKWMKRILSGGMQLDLHPKHIAPEDYVRSLNIYNGVSRSGKHFIVQNVDGTRLVNYALPSGVNKVIGRFEDTKNQTCIYMVRNSNGDHSILRYYRSTNTIIKVLQDPLLNFSSVIGSINLVDDLFSWTTGDGNPQREFNIVRAQRQDENGVFKPVEFDIYFNFVNFRNGDSYSLTYTDLNGNPQNIVVYTATSDLSTEDGVRDFVSQFNAAQSDFTAESCGFFVEVTANNGGIYDPQIVTNLNTVTGQPSSASKRVFTNIYPDDFLETFINADKNPPQCEPSVTVQTDTNEKNNFIVGKVFEFQVSYVYSDGQISSLSPTSIHPIGSGNYIKVDFTDIRLNDENLTIIKGVRLYVREGELGKLKFITQLDRYQFGIGTNYYNFFNDKSYSEVDDAYAIKLFEAIPITSEAQEVFGNRKGYGDNVEGYDRVCVDTQLSVAYKQPPELYTIKGIVVIRPLFLDSTTSPDGNWGSSLRRNSAIFKSVDKYFFGTDGLTERGLGIGQEIPLQGFVFYLAGTEFYGISKQIKSAWSVNQELNTGAYNFTAGGRADVIAENQSNTNNDYAFRSRNPFGLGSGAVDQNGRYIGDRTFNTSFGTNIYSIFEITGVPEGEYVLRVAGTETTADDLNGTGYQKTSAYCISVGAASNQIFPTVPQGFELKVKVGANAIAFNTTTAENFNNTIIVGCSAMADLTTPIGTAGVTTGYLCDSDLSTSTGNYNNVLTDTRIERALVKFSSSYTPVACRFNTSQPNWSQRSWVSNYATTDHNGFFYHVSSASDTLGVASQVGTLTVSVGTDVYLESNPAVPIVLPYTTSGSPGYSRVAIRNTNTNITTKAKTYVTGRVIDGTSPQDNVPVINLLGSWQPTDQDGRYQLPTYIDTFSASFLPPFATNERISEIVFSSANNGTLVYDFAVDFIFYDIIIGTAIGNYNNTSESFWYLLADMQADLLEQFLSLSDWKRGVAEEIGIIYLDRENRQTTVNDHIRKVYVPFYTENNTAGSAEISWEIQSLPPDWATHYQWVRTHSVPPFLQFNATSIDYVDSADNTTSFTNAAFIKIGFNSLLQYQQRYPQSSIGYTFTRGDRVRLISNGSGTLYGSYLDAEVIKDLTSGNNYYIYVDRSNTQFTPDVGTLFEIYTPTPSSAIQYYEFGECFEIGDPRSNQRFHKGLTQNQDPNDPVNIPATGTFRTGNVYYRFRNFVLGGAKYIEDSSVSDFYDSFTTQTGRPQILDKNAKQVHRPTLIRFSNQYFSGSSVNGFSSFEALNQKELDRVFGGIRIMSLMAQSVLLVVCENRTQTFYVNKATINIPSNTPNLISLSDAVLNQADTLIGEWGTQHKLSFDSYDNLGWWYDEKKGVVPRYASNGMFLISDYGAKSYFNERGLVSNENIVGGYDPFHNLFILSFGDTQSRAGETIVFNDGAEQGKNRWITFYSFLPDCIGRIGNTLITFKDGSLYVHDSPVRNNFYGTQYTSSFQISANDEVSDRKVIESSALEALQAWETTAEVEPNAMRPAGQITRIKSGKYKMKEGQFFSEFQGDINSLGGIINGDRLRGEYFLVTYENNSTDFTELYGVNISFVDSPRNIGK